MDTERINKLIKILDVKVDGGLKDLEGIPINTEEYTICLNNLLSSMDLLNKLQFKPQPNQTKNK